MNFFKNIFKKNKPSENKPEDIISIKYAVTHDGEIEINLEWADSSPITSEMLGELIPAVHAGALDQAVLNILIEHASKNTQDALFISKVINCWSEIILKMDKLDPNPSTPSATDDAVISPSQVFGTHEITDNKGGTV